MATPVEEPTLQEVRESPTLLGPRVGQSLLRLALALLSLGYLFTFVPVILSPALDLLALAVLGGLTARWMIRLVWSRRS